MFDVPSEVRMRIAVGSTEFHVPGTSVPMALGRLLPATSRATRGGERPVIVRGEFSAGVETAVSEADCVALPEPTDLEAASLLLPLASALSLWDRVGLELGDAAVWTSGGVLSKLVGQVALWRGACPVIGIGPALESADQSMDGGDYIDWSDAEQAARRLNELIEGRPGLAAVDLSGRADVIDILLEAIPTFGRLLLAGPPGEVVTIDFYKNVHRKGVVIASTKLEPALVFDGAAGASSRLQLQRAATLLSRPQIVERCRSLLGSASHVSLSGARCQDRGVLAGK